MLAALAYKKVEDTDMFKSLLENIIDGDSSNIGVSGLLYLKWFTVLKVVYCI